MVKSLIKLAFVKRYRAADSRTWIVQLTARGREVVTRAYDALINRGDATVIVDDLITDCIDASFSIGAQLGNRVRRNGDLYCWDIEEFYAALTTYEERDSFHYGVPFVDPSTCELVPRVG